MDKALAIIAAAPRGGRHSRGLVVCVETGEVATVAAWGAAIAAARKISKDCAEGYVYRSIRRNCTSYGLTFRLANEKTGAP